MQTNDWARRHGFALILAFGLAMIVASVVLIAADRDANFLVAGGTVLLVIGGMAGRLAHLKFGREGFEADLSGQALAHELRKAEAAVDSDGNAAEPDEAGVAPAGVLETAAAAVEATTPDEKTQRLEELRRYTSPIRRGMEAEEWVMDLERAAGRSPERLQFPQVADISSPPRKIEVKLVRAGKYAVQYLRLTESEFNAAQQDPSFFLYVVEERDDTGSERFGLRVFAFAQARYFFAIVR